MSLITAAELNDKLDSSLWPTVLSVDIQQDTAQFSLHVTSDLSYFSGHFPTQAVLPGVVQIHWAGELCKLLFDSSGFSELASVKFNSMILPRQTVDLSLRFNVDRQSLRFDYVGKSVDGDQTRDEKFSSGSLVFANEVT